jgi:hypothetical protein
LLRASKQQSLQQQARATQPAGLQQKQKLRKQTWKLQQQLLLHGRRSC